MNWIDHLGTTGLNFKFVGLFQISRLGSLLVMIPLIWTIYPSDVQAAMRWAVSFPQGIELSDAQIPTTTLTLTNCVIGNSSSELRCSPAIATTASSAFSQDAIVYAGSLRDFIGFLYPATVVIFASIAIPKVLRAVFSGI